MNHQLRLLRKSKCWGWFRTYSDTNDRVSSHRRGGPAVSDVIIIKEGDDDGNGGKSHIRHAVALFNIDDGFTHLLFDRQENYF